MPSLVNLCTVKNVTISQRWEEYTFSHFCIIVFLFSCSYITTLHGWLCNHVHKGHVIMDAEHPYSHWHDNVNTRSGRVLRMRTVPSGRGDQWGRGDPWDLSSQEARKTKPWGWVCVVGGRGRELYCGQFFYGTRSISSNSYEVRWDQIFHIVISHWLFRISSESIVVRMNFKTSSERY